MKTEIMELIDAKEQFIISEDGKQFKRLCEWKLYVPYCYITDDLRHFNVSDGSVYQL